MRRIFTTVSVMLMSAVMMLGTEQSRGRQSYGNASRQPSHTSQSRPSHGNRPGSNNNNNRPGGRPTPPPNNGNNRPGGNNPGGRPTPPPNNGNNNRPGGNNPGGRPTPPPNNGNNRPGGRPTPPPSAVRPTPPPNNHHRPSGRPLPPPNAGRPAPPPSWHYRPYMPVNRPWSRPVPPPSFRPHRGSPVIHAILGVTFGTALDLSLNYLMNNGYTVAGYGTNTIYLSNVMQYNYSWPAATMHYTNGVLSGTEFVYSSPAFDMSRYNILYNSLVSQYGYPVSIQNQGGGNVSATWWGYNNGYITLSYYNEYAYNGTYRYYTTLSIGN